MIRIKHLILIIVATFFIFLPVLAFCDQSGIDEKLSQIIVEILKRQNELGLKPTVHSALQKSRDTTIFTSLMQVSGPNGTRERLLVRSLFDSTSPTIRKHSVLRQDKNKASFISTLDNEGKPFKQIIRHEGPQDFQIYDRQQDTFAYTQSKDDSGIASLKEWAYVKQPNRSWGSEYIWDYTSDENDKEIFLKPEEYGVVKIYQRNKRNTSTNGMSLFSDALHAHPQELASMRPLTYWTSNGIKKQAQVRVIAKSNSQLGSNLKENDRLDIQIHEPKESYPLLLDPTLKYGQFMGSGIGSTSTRVTSIAAVGGIIYTAGIANTGVFDDSVTFFGIPGGSGSVTEGFVVEIQDGGTPALNWGQWLGGSLNTVVNGIAISGSHILAGGYTASSSSWQSMSIQGTYGALDVMGYVVEIQDGGTPVLNWGQWLGGSSLNTLTSIAISGSHILAGGYTHASSSWQTMSIQGNYNGGLYMGFVVEIQDGGTPVLNWGQWLGGGGNTNINGITINGGNILVGGATQVSTSWQSMSIQGTYNNNSPSSNTGFVVEIKDGGTPVLNWGQWLGGSSNAQVSGIAVSGSHILAEGYTLGSASWQSMSIQGTYNSGSNSSSFLVEIQDGGTPTLNWGQWLGGSIQTELNNIAISGSHILVGGFTSSSSSWQSMTFQGPYEGASTVLVEIQDGGTPVLNWGQWVGGSAGASGVALAVSGSHIFVGGYTFGSNSWQSMSIQGTFVGGNFDGFTVEVQDGGTPVLNWGQWLGGGGENGLSSIQSVAVNSSNNVLVGGYTGGTVGWPNTIFQGPYEKGVSEGFVVEIQNGGTPALNWGQWLGGSSPNAVNAIAVSNSHILAGGYTTGSSSWQSMSIQGAYTAGGASYSGFVAEIQDGGTPALNWGQWLGGNLNTMINSIAISGSHILAGGYTQSSASWQSISIQGAYNDTTGTNNMGFVVEVQDGGTPGLNWGQWLGGSHGTSVLSVAISGSHILAGGTTLNSSSWQSMSIQGTYNSPGTNSGFVAEIQDGGTPVLNWGQWIGGSTTTLINGIVISGSHILAGGLTTNSGSWQSMSMQGTYGGIRDGFVVEIQDGGTPALNWGQWLGGSGSDQVMGIAISGSHILAGGITTSSSSWQSMSIFGTYNAAGNTSGFLVEIQDGGTPVLNWGQWLGGSGNNVIYTVAISGDEIYTGGYATASSSWQSVTIQGNLAYSSVQEGFIVREDEPLVAGSSSGSANTIFFSSDY